MASRPTQRCGKFSQLCKSAFDSWMQDLHIETCNNANALRTTKPALTAHAIFAGILRQAKFCISVQESNSDDNLDCLRRWHRLRTLFEIPGRAGSLVVSSITRLICAQSGVSLAGQPRPILCHCQGWERTLDVINHNIHRHYDIRKSQSSNVRISSICPPRLLQATILNRYRCLLR
jgi:hypothetical protein